LSTRPRSKFDKDQFRSRSNELTFQSVGELVVWRLIAVNRQGGGLAHTLLRTVATPIPKPVHIVTRPYSRFRLSSSSINVPTRIAPVAPTGCPIAIEPPVTLIESKETPVLSMKYKTTDAKASLTSKRSMSPKLSPARSRAFRAAAAGAVSIIQGSSAALAVEMIFARGLAPSRSATRLFPTKTVAAPSAIPEEFPA